MSLPGSILRLSPNTYCDHEDHQGRLAVKCVQGETDSFGHEKMNMCQDCYDAFIASDDPLVSGECDWCKAEVTTRAPTRDMDEGFNGPVYYVCFECRRKQNREAEEELNDFENSDGRY